MSGSRHRLENFLYLCYLRFGPGLSLVSLARDLLLNTRVDKIYDVEDTVDDKNLL